MFDRLVFVSGSSFHEALSFKNGDDCAKKTFQVKEK